MLRKLKKEEKDSLIEDINLQYESCLEVEGLFLSKDEKRESKKIFLYTGERIPDVPAEWTGIHFCTIKEGVIIPSIEGAQYIGQTAKKVIDLDKEQAAYVMSGRDVDLAEEKEKGYYILLNGNDVLGIGLAENKKILNMTPKSRRTMQQYRTI
jgi:NOL1/NOP2/fmu family ribosome biogenesis protein